MGFATYQADQYKKYLKQHKRTITDIYRFITEAPMEFTYIGKQIGYNYFQFHYRMKRKSFTEDELLKILDLIG